MLPMTPPSFNKYFVKIKIQINPNTITADKNKEIKLNSSEEAMIFEKNDLYRCD
jgi:hypothetical protein